MEGAHHHEPTLPQYQVEQLRNYQMPGAWEDFTGEDNQDTQRFAHWGLEDHFINIEGR